MKHLQAGSALLVVIMITALMSIVLVQVWCCSVYAVAIARKRITYEQQANAVQALLHHAIAYATANREYMITHSGQPVIITLQWPPVNSLWQGTMCIQQGADELSVGATLSKNGTTVCSRTCRLVPEKRGDKTVSVIRNWT